MIKRPFCMVVLFGAAATLSLSGEVRAQTPTPPSQVATGSANVTVEGHAASREGDQTLAADTVVEGSSNVRINGKPAARAGDKTECGGVIIGGSATVFVNGKPLATQGSTVSGC